MKRGKAMRKLLWIAVILVLLAGVSPAFADSGRYGTQLSVAVQTSTALVLPADTWVYGITIFADEASSFMGVYDAATLGACTNATVKDEIGEATQYDTAEKHYTKPIFFTSGVSVVMSTGVAWVEYGPAP